MWSLYTVYHFWMRSFSGRVPVCGAGVARAGRVLNRQVRRALGRGESGRRRAAARCLRGEELLEVADGVIRVALDSDLLSEPVVADDLDHTAATRTARGGAGGEGQSAAITAKKMFVSHPFPNQAAPVD